MKNANSQDAMVSMKQKASAPYITRGIAERETHHGTAVKPLLKSDQILEILRNLNSEAIAKTLYFSRTIASPQRLDG